MSQYTLPVARRPARWIPAPAVATATAATRATRRRATSFSRVVSVFSALSLLTGTTLLAQEWPQFLGPTRNGVYAGPALADAWSGDGPTQVWTKRIGAGFAGPVVADGRVILFHRIRDFEVVEALDPLTGRTQWNREYATSYRDDVRTSI